MSIFDQSAEDALRAQIRVMRQMRAGQDAIDAKTAQNVLHEDLGYFSSKTAAYDLDPPTRDKLLAHARQDASHAVYASMTVAREVRRLRGTVCIFGLLIVALLAANLMV